MERDPREVVGLEAALWWATFALFFCLNLPWRRMIREYIQERKAKPR